MSKLILIAGTSCAGKSTLIRHFRAGRLPDLANHLNINPANCSYLEAGQLSLYPWRELDSLVLHYDLYTQFSNSRFNHLDDLLAHYHQVSLIRLHAERSSLQIRIVMRILRRFQCYLFRKPKQKISPLFERLWFCQSPCKLDELYMCFDKYILQNGITNILDINTSSMKSNTMIDINKKLEITIPYQHKMKCAMNS